MTHYNIFNISFYFGSTQNLFFFLVGILVPEYHFSVPHDLTIAEDKNLVCVSDRENGRIQCFLMTNGSFIFQIQSPEIGFRVFSASYTPANGKFFFIC